jgi:WD40 repeat protein
MKLMNEQEASRLLGCTNVNSFFTSNLNKPGAEALRFKLPREAARQTILAKYLATLFCSENPCWLQITYWHDDSDANQDLFYGYRSGRGDVRKLQDASVYEFSPDDANQFISIVSMVLYFSWDARVFDPDEAFFINISHDEFIDCVVSSRDSLELLVSEFARLEMRRL